jgi:hypothetical protein
MLTTSGTQFSTTPCITARDGLQVSDRCRCVVAPLRQSARCAPPPGCAAVRSAIAWTSEIPPVPPVALSRIEDPVIGRAVPLMNPAQPTTMIDGHAPDDYVDLAAGKRSLSFPDVIFLPPVRGTGRARDSTGVTSPTWLPTRCASRQVRTRECHAGQCREGPGPASGP